MDTFDVAIIGGGAIGGAIAFELAGEKLRVVVLDRQPPAAQSRDDASWAAAGMLSPAPHSLRDFPLVPLAKRSAELYPEFVAEIEETSGISTAYARRGTLEIFFGPRAEAERGASVAEQQRFGLAAEAVTRDAAREIEPALGSADAMRARTTEEEWAAAWLAQEATVEPRPLRDAVLAAAHARGAAVRPGCAVASLLCEGQHCTGVVTTAGEKIAALHVVVAAGCYSAAIRARGAPSDENLAARYAPVRPVRGQIVALKAPERVKLRRILRSKKGYLVPQRGGRILAGSTLEEAGFDRRVTAEGMRRILAGALELLPPLADAEVAEIWAGLRPGTPDDLPIVGPTDIEGLLMATGHFRNGILLAPATAKLIRECVMRGRVLADAAAFSPMRFAQARGLAAKG